MTAIYFAFFIGSSINYKQTLKSWTNVKRSKEKDCHYLAHADVKGKNTVESSFSLVTTEESHLQVPELIREEIVDMPAFGISAYQAIY